ncbi:hypothetical protein ONS95_007159 [Cadophora gregata]|uniref:uncharacterized protein n=1 Tax=Cadophora gregata TaxID=51156 RepID=UPI0026DC8F28|nr:uncharacterized protein ONS95_007159 [Cadophora gregata]KAK0100708.1 hypothetical protein ONS95_007159 [Cadophora gregata]KAK0117295.1 hypothetical protein ONS96_013128 [Cadophora gregata f. sp. sojae]
MSKRSKRRQRQRQRRFAASAEYETMGTTEQGVVEEQAAEPVGLQYGKEDPIGFRTIADGYIPMEKFMFFPKLPLELRRFVWNRLLPEPQSIYMISNGHTQKLTVGSITRNTYIYRAAASYKVPLLLSVCKETRQEVMFHHPPCFATNFGGVPIYYNRKIDLLHFDNPDALLHFHGGSAPNYLPRSITRGFRLNMYEFYNTVSQIAVGNVRAQEGMLGAIFNQMKALKVVLLADKLCRPQGKSIINDYCHGIKDLEMGWEEYTIDRKTENKVEIKLVNFDEFKETILGWKGRIISEEEEGARKAEEAEAAVLQSATATQQPQVSAASNQSNAGNTNPTNTPQS